MRTILCYGDSNTWGWNPITRERFPRRVRWPGRLQRELGRGYYVVEEGLIGRTTVWDDPIEEHKNGKTYLAPCLESHKPLDLIILMLGTNDLKTRFGLSAYDISAGIEKLLNIIQISRSGHCNKVPQILLLPPPLVGDLDRVGEQVFAGAQDKSKSVCEYVRQSASTFGCLFLDTHSFLKPSSTEGLHLDEMGHYVLAKEIVRVVKETFSVSK